MPYTQISSASTDLNFLPDHLALSFIVILPLLVAHRLSFSFSNLFDLFRGFQYMSNPSSPPPLQRPLRLRRLQRFVQPNRPKPSHTLSRLHLSHLAAGFSNLLGIFRGFQ